MKQFSERVKKILSEMTLEEKAVQLSCIVPAMTTTRGVFSEEKAAESMPNGVGRMTQFASGFVQGPKQAAEGYNAIQKYVIEKTGLPAIIQNESSSGVVAAEGTIFPVPLAFGATFDDQLAYRFGKVLGDEGRAIGPHAMMSPVADVGRDSRWGRVDETFGEDPLVCARFSSEEVHGIQGEDYTKRCAALAKHWLAYGASEGGTNCATININPKEIFETFATPFAAAIQEHDMQSVMVTYSEIDGRPMSVNDYYTQEVLRNKLGFTGIAVCDGGSIPRVIDIQGMFEDREELAAMALKAGIDADTPMTDVYHHIVSGVRNGKIDEKDLDTCVLRTLQFREEMGLLDHPFVDPEKAVEVFADPKADELSEEVAQKSITLLKNNGILPLKKDVRKIAIIGPFADRRFAFYGGYGYPAMMGSFLEASLNPEVSVMEGFAELINNLVDIPSLKEKMYKDPSKPFSVNMENYLKEELGTLSFLDAFKLAYPEAEVVAVSVGNDLKHFDEQLEEALKAAADADVVIFAAGEITGQGAEATSGEGVNNPDLELPFRQQDALEAVHALDIPVVLLLTNGRALALGKAEPLCDAIVENWYPGPAGGKPAVNVISGAFNPTGHLPVTIPQISAQCPIYYYHHTGSGYMNIHQKPDKSVLQPLYPFGYGLSYTNFEMTDFQYDKEVETGGQFTCSVKVRNTGERKGSHLVQIYTHSTKPTVNRPIKELRAWKQVELEAGEEKTVKFTLDTRQFGYLNWKNEFVIEARPQEIYVCTDSSTIVDRGEISFTGEDKEILHDRVYNFVAEEF